MYRIGSLGMSFILSPKRPGRLSGDIYKSYSQPFDATTMTWRRT